jgi:hypothetical protein
MLGVLEILKFGLRKSVESLNIKGGSLIVP